MQTNEFRVRPVTRFVLTHFQADEAARSSSSRQIGEFLNVETAEEVGVALQALVPGSTLETIEGRQAAYPPKALAAALATRRARIGDVIPVVVNAKGDIADMEVYAVHEFASGQRVLDCSFIGGVFIEGRGTGTVADEQPYRLHAPSPLGEPAAAKFVIVQRGFDVETRAYYAYSEEEAQQARERAENDHGREFRIFAAA